MLTKLYTRTGDKGETSLFGGGRVPKDDLRVEAYGALDEADAAVGFARSLCRNKEVAEALKEAQRGIHLMEAELASPKGMREDSEVITDSDVKALEGQIDAATDNLKPLTDFVIPGENPSSAALHVARTVLRRAERRVVSLDRETPIRPELLSYLNRLSDLLFALARVEAELQPS